MRIVGLSLLLLAGCSQPERPENGAVDINAAAERAQGDIAGYAANTEIAQQPPVDAAAPVPIASAAADAAPDAAPLTPAAPGQPGGLPDDRTPIAEGPFAPDSAQGAADVVQRYYALIESGRYRQAWALWGNGGADSKQSAAAFVAGFGKYREYHANIGAPGDVDAGAGQRYVTVPVQVYARLSDGRPDYRLGNVVLHRVDAGIDGATAEQKQWRIRSIDLKPAPGGKPAGAGSGTSPAAPPPAVPSVVTARYRCVDGSRMTVRFDNRADSAAIASAGRPVATLAGQRPASGIWYRGDGYDLRGKGDDATFSAPGKPPVACTAIR